jgi:hypothetical protein
MSIESVVQAMTTAERVAYLKEHGWYRLSAGGSQTWFSPGWQRVSRYTVEPPESDRSFYSLAVAIRKAVAAEHGVTLPTSRNIDVRHLLPEAIKRARANIEKEQHR